MKTKKYLSSLLKMFLYLSIIAFLVYYRSVIFLPHINQYVDKAQFFLENKYQITIPVYMETTSDRKYINTKLANSTDEFNFRKNDLDIERNIEINRFDMKPASNGSSLAVDERVEFENKSKESPVKNTINSELQKQDIAKNEVIFNSDKKVNTGEKSVVVDQDIINKMSETVDVINKKVDRLFDVNSFNRSSAIIADNSKDNAEKLGATPNREIQTNSQPTNEIVGNNYSTNYGLSKDHELSKGQGISGDQGVSEGRVKMVLNNSQTHVDKNYSTNDSGIDRSEILFTARKMFWSGYPLDSEKLYLDLLGIEADNPEIYGELGNVYYAQGKWKEAGKAYYEAAIRLLELKKNNQAMYLLRVIQGLDAESAEKLKLKISG